MNQLHTPWTEQRLEDGAKPGAEGRDPGRAPASPEDAEQQDNVYAEDLCVAQFLRPLRPLLDGAQVTEVCVNEPGRAHVETFAGWHAVAVPEMSYERCLALATAVATFGDQAISEGAPLLSTTLPSGERIQVVVPPVTARGSVAISIRKPALGQTSLRHLAAQGMFARLRSRLDDAVANDKVANETAADEKGAKPAEQGCAVQAHGTSGHATQGHVTHGAAAQDPQLPAAPPELDDPRLLVGDRKLLRLRWLGRYREFFAEAVQAKRTIVVAGDTGSGKTTFIRALLDEVPRAERLITIEDARELTLPEHPNKVHLYYSQGKQGVADVTPTELLRACLRMKPDRILLGELRGPEAWDFLNVCASGHPGGMSSVHAASCALTFERLAFLVGQSPSAAALRYEQIKRLLLLVVDIVVHIERVPGEGRFVREIYFDPLRKLAEARI